ncbi:hypothetical protein COO60DRAFT_945676 [Scenedesmus sp. NREL 46B-D3]|nr:hypothetical protein COO60DRAFT_945676 [Scenedesmus sp. NREL 46B-D3]
MADESDGCLSSSTSSTETLTITAQSRLHGEEESVGVGGSAASGFAAAVAPVEPANWPAGKAADPSGQLLAAYGCSSRVVNLQNPAAASATAAAAAAVRVCAAATAARPAVMMAVLHAVLAGAAAPSAHSGLWAVQATGVSVVAAQRQQGLAARLQG